MNPSIARRIAGTKQQEQAQQLRLFATQILITNRKKKAETISARERAEREMDLR